MAQAQFIAKVSVLSGQAFARDSAGNMRRLKLGDAIREGESVVAAQGANVVLTLADGREMNVRPGETAKIDAEVVATVRPDAADSAVVNNPQGFQKITQALQAGTSLDDLLEDTAAGAGPQGGNEGHTFVELLRIVESVDPLAYQFGTNRGAPVDTVEGAPLIADAVAAAVPAKPTISIPDANNPGGADGDKTVAETSGPVGGTFAITAPAGLASLTIGGQTFTVLQLADPVYLAAHPVNTGKGILILQGYDPVTGVVSYTYDPAVQSHNGSVLDNIPVAVADTLGNSTPDSLDITITDSVPVAVNDTISITENAAPNSVSGSVLTGVGADTVGADANPTPVTPANVTLAHGTLVLNANGSYTYTLNNADSAVNALAAGQTLTDSYTYTLTDGDGSTTTAVLSITINGSNDAPVDGNETNTVTEDTTLTVAAGSGLLANTVDPDGGTPSVTGYTVQGMAGIQAVDAPVVIAGVGTLTIHGDGAYSFVPAANYTGAIPLITYTVSDGNGGTDTSTLTLSMSPVNDPPVATPSAASGDEDTPITIALGGTDIDGTIQSVTVTSLPPVAQGVLYLPDGVTPVLAGTPLTPADAANLVFKPAADFNGTVSVPFTVTDNSSAVSTPAQATITVNPVVDPVISINDVTVNEAAGTISFTVTLDQPTTATVTVGYNTGDGSAVSPADYGVGSGTLTFAPGVVTQTITVAIANDTIYEGSESFNVNLSAPVNATIGDGLGIGTIKDDGTGPGGSDNDTPSLAVSSPTVAESGGYAQFTVSLSNPSAVATTVSLALTNGSATSPADYTAALEVSTDGGATWTAASSATIAPNTTSVLVRTPVIDDSLAEPNENFTLTATTTGGVTANPSATGTATITDNDTPAFSINDVSVNEGAGTITFTVTLSNPSASATSIDYATVAGSATTPADYAAGASALNGSLNFAAGVTSQTITLAIANDGTYEGAETFAINLSNATGGAVIADNQGIGTILDNGTGPGGSDNDTPSLAVSSPTVAEDAGYAQFTVSLSNPSTVATTVSLALTNGSASSPADYSTALEVSTDGGATWTAASSATIAPNATSVLVRTPIINDSIGEATENFTLTATTTGGVTANPSAQGLGTITDNDTPTVSISGPVTYNEAAGTATFTVTLTNASDLPVTVNYGTANGTALAGSDYTAGSGTLTFAPGTVSQTITVAITNDTVFEGPETFNVNLSAPANATLGTASSTATIIDDGTGSGGNNDDRPNLVINDVVVNEATGMATFTVTLSAAADLPVTVGYNMNGVSATAGTDFTAGSGTLTFAPGIISQTISVPIANDAVYEGAETFNVNLVSPTNATLADALGLGTIMDDGTGTGGNNDDRPTVTGVSSPTVVEGAHLDFTVTLSNTSTTNTAVTLSTASGSATKGVDFAAGGQVSFNGGLTWAALAPTINVPAGSNSFIVRIPTVNDNISEPTETMTLSASTAQNAVPVVGTGSILDNDGTPTLSIAGPAVVNEAAGTLTYTVTLSNPSASTVTVNYGTADGTATAGSDYAASSGTLSFAPGETTKTFTVAITNDTVFEGNENYTVNLSAPSNATIATGSVGTTIADDGTGSGGNNDDRPQVSGVSSPTAVEGNALDFTVTLSNTSTTPTVVTLTPASGSAVLGTDTTTPIQVSFDGGSSWTTVSGPTVSVPAGSGSFIVRVPTVNDVISEPSETITLSASTAQNAGQVQGTGTITDNDGTPTLSINDVTVNEAAGTATFTVTLSNPSASTVTVGYNTGDGSAVSPADYGVGSGTLTFAPGVVTQTITVAIANDTIYEGSESFNVNLSAPVNATIGDGLGIGTIKDDGTGPGGSDNDTPSLAVSSPTVAESGGYAQFTVSLSNPSAVATTVSLALTNGSATSPADYTAALEVSTDGGATWAAASSATIAPNTTSVLVRTPVVDDLLVEGSETFTLTATRVAGATSNVSASGIVTIQDNDHAPVAIADTNSSPEDTTATGNVLGNDTDADGNTLSVTQFVVNGTTYAAGSTATLVGVGSLTINANGSYTFVPVANWNGSVPQATYTVTDGANPVTSTLSITTTPVNDAPVVSAPLPVSVSEEGLANGIVDTTGTSDTTNATVATGNLGITDPDNNTFAISVTAPATTLTSNGVTVTWSGGSAGTDLVGMAGAKEIIRVHVTNTGAYTVTLSGPVDHATAGQEDVKALNFGLSVSDGTAPAVNTTLTVNVEDDAPTASNITQAVEAAPTSSNVMLVIDVSGSMATTDGPGGATRLQTAKDAINQLLTQYDNMGEVRVQIIAFSSSANILTSEWVSISQAQTIINGLAANGGTNYDAGISSAMEAYNQAGKLAGAQNIAYFFSDGTPTYGVGDVNTLTGTRNGTGGSTTTDSGIDPNEEAIWKDFLSANEVTAHAIGLGSGVTVANLNPIAYDGATNTDANALVVTNLADLSSALTATVPPALVGQLLTGGLVAAGQGIGADGGYVRSITVDGTLYTYNPVSGGSVAVSGTDRSTFDTSNNSLTVTTLNGGKFIVDMDDGNYSYTPPAVISGTKTEAMNYVLMDNDGDSASATITFNVSRAPEPTVTMGSTTYTGDAYNDNVTGTASADTISAGAGNDLIDGGAGNDTIIGGAGHDTLIGALGADTFKWVLGDAGTTSAPAHDVIKDFAQAAITLTNPGAESVSVGDGSTSNTVTGWTSNDGNTARTANPDTGAFLLDQDNAFRIVSDGDATEDRLSQTLSGATFSTNGLWTVTVDVGWAQTDGTAPTYRVELWAGSTRIGMVDQSSSPLIQGQFVEASFTVDGANYPAVANGTALQVRLVGLSGSAYFDNVQVTQDDGDKLDLRDLLVGESHIGTDSGNLANFLHFEKTESGTTLHVSSTGGYSGGYSAGATNQTISLEGINLVGTNATDAQVIQDLLTKGKLITD